MILNLNFEIRNFVGIKIGGGYSWFIIGYLNPTKFIKANREVSK